MYQYHFRFYHFHFYHFPFRLTSLWFHVSQLTCWIDTRIMAEIVSRQQIKECVSRIQEVSIESRKLAAETQIYSYFIALLELSPLPLPYRQ